MFPGISFFALLLLVSAPLLRSAEIIPEEVARKHFTNGAVLIDVRTIEEYKAAHLTNATHIPLNAVKQKVPQHFPDKGQTLLLHCRTGRRSGLAEQELKTMGYTNVYNVGSLEQASRVTQSKPVTGK